MPLKCPRMIISWWKRNPRGEVTKWWRNVISRTDIRKCHFRYNVIQLPRQSQSQVNNQSRIVLSHCLKLSPVAWLYVSSDWRLSIGGHSRAKVCSSPRTTASQSCAASCDSDTCRVLQQLSTCLLDVVHTLFLKGKPHLRESPMTRQSRGTPGLFGNISCSSPRPRLSPVSGAFLRFCSSTVLEEIASSI